MVSFVSLFGALALVLSQCTASGRGSAPAALMSPDEARKVIVGCGLPSQRVSVAYERDTQENVVWVASDDTPLPEPTLACLARASLQTIYYVYFRDHAEQKRYWPIYGAISNEVEVAKARKWLRDRSLLATMPLPKKGSSLASYAKAVEAFCGVRPGSLLVARTNEFMTFAEGGLGRITSNGVKDAAATNEQFKCVMNATSAADLQSNHIFVGFIGNAARAADDR